VNSYRMPNASAAAMALITAVAAAVIGPVATAHAGELALNGTYAALSNGEWAKTNESYHDEVSVRSVWTISSTCNNPQECTGTVSSDQGWTAPLRKTAVAWIVDRVIPNWEPCPDGSAAPGQQKIRFWRVGADGRVDVRNESQTYAGLDNTMSPSGACGINQPLVVTMPFRLERLAPSDTG
jgi:hypothetical protein